MINLNIESSDKMGGTKFIDLFAGIGGFRLALEKLGAKCVFSSEKNEHAAEIYEKNFWDRPYGDITKIDANTIPDFDILCVGFPCQSFSIAGEKKDLKIPLEALYFLIYAEF